jgi:hypothetical protein
MKNLLFTLALLILPIMGLSQSNDRIDELFNAFSNIVCSYTNGNGDTLFDGGDFDITSPDISKVKTYRCDCFEGEFFKSGAMILFFDVTSKGTKQLRSIRFVPSDENTLPQIYFDLNEFFLGDN